MKRKIVLLGASAVLVLSSLAANPKPRRQLKLRIDAEEDVIGIVHWGLNTYTDKEWGFGDENPQMLNPDRFSADQIVGACKAGGLAGLVVVAKHHDGFCLWPTETTGHNISKSPFRGGRGDYVGEMAKACRKAGIKFGVYCSPWDRNSADYGKPEYVEKYHAQLRELLDGRYGSVFEVWLDGANGGTGWYGGAKGKRSIPPGYYRYGEIYAFVRAMQPNATIFGGELPDMDYRWPGNEKGVVDPEKSAVRGEHFSMWEADFPLRRGWFHHDKERNTVRSGEFLMKIYLRTVGNGGTMNIGIAPDRHGLLPDEDVEALKRFGEIRRRFFARSSTFSDCVTVYVYRDKNNIKKIRFAEDGKIGLRKYFVDRELVRSVVEARGPDTETDTAKWMKDFDAPGRRRR